jgi:hypothetical protein
MNNMPFVFLLGGQDLEMLTIKKLLLDSGFPEHQIADNDLSWGAKLSNYQKLLNDEQIFVGVELTQDIATPPHYIEIDHHNENSNKGSSLEQVAELLGVKLTREQQLIAANDKGFIPAMEAMGATPEEVADIRRRDRKAQGVTDEDERLGEQSINENRTVESSTTVVKSLTSKFSTITDRLYPCNRLLIYTSNELNFYGKGARFLASVYANLRKEGKAYFGGEGEGYFGINPLGMAFLGGNAETIKDQIIKLLENE